MHKTFAALVGAVCLIAQAAAQPASPPERDPIRFAIGSDEIVIDDRALVPRQIARVATQAGCSFQSALESKESVRIIRTKPTPNNTVMFALVPCVAGPYVATLVLHLANQVREPVVVQLPVMAERGFTASTYAGYVSWGRGKVDTDRKARQRHVSQSGGTSPLHHQRRPGVFAGARFFRSRPH